MLRAPRQRLVRCLDRGDVHARMRRVVIDAVIDDSSSPSLPGSKPGCGTTNQEIGCCEADRAHRASHRPPAEPAIEQTNAGQSRERAICGTVQCQRFGATATWHTQCLSQLAEQPPDVAAARARRPHARRIDVQHRAMRRQSPRDVVAAGAVLGEPFVAEVDDVDAIGRGCLDSVLRPRRRTRQIRPPPIARPRVAPNQSLRTPGIASRNAPTRRIAGANIVTRQALPRWFISSIVRANVRDVVQHFARHHQIEAAALAAPRLREDVAGGEIGTGRRALGALDRGGAHVDAIELVAERLRHSRSGALRRSRSRASSCRVAGNGAR